MVGLLLQQSIGELKLMRLLEVLRGGRIAEGIQWINAWQAWLHFSCSNCESWRNMYLLIN